MTGLCVSIQICFKWQDIRHGYDGLSIAANALRNKCDAVWLRLKSLGHKSKSLQKEVELCLLICSMFLDDSRIPIDDLVMYSMSLELFEDVDDIFAARSRVNDLISIINNKKYPRNVVGGKIRLTHEKDGPYDHSVKMLVGARNLVKLMPLSCPLVFSLQTIREKWPDLHVYKDLYGLSLVLKKVKDHPIYLECPKLSLLHIQYREDSQVIPIDFLTETKELSILSLDIPSLPQFLIVPNNLRTLRIKVIKLEDVSWIGGLINLEFLSISTSSFTYIPREMGNLEKLRLLDLKKVNLAYIPPGVLSRMLNLEELYLPFSFGRWGLETKQLDDYDEWDLGEEYGEEKINAVANEIDNAQKTNTSLVEIASPSLNVLHISIAEASFLPKMSPIFKNIRKFKDHVPNYIKYQPLDKDSSNELHLTGDACDIKGSGICDLMGRTEDLILMRVKNLKNVMYFLENSDLPFLKKMIISECEALECVVDATEKHIPPEDNYSFWKLESLHLSMLHNLKEICNERWTNFQWFSNLSQLSIRFCHNLRYVFPMSLFSGRILLKDIEILDCNELEGVFYEDEEANVPLMLDCIENLDLHSLPKLIGFSIPKDNIVDGVHDSGNQPLTTNEVSPIKNKDDLISPIQMNYVFAFKFAEKGLQNLKRLKIAFCDSIAIIFVFDENHVASRALISLKELQLYGLRNLVHIWFHVPHKTSAFQSLQLLSLSECNNAYLFSPQVAKLLGQLKKVYISRCEKMEEIIVNGDNKLAKNEIVFPKLEHLELQYMPNLKIFSSGIFDVRFPLLDSLKLNQCNEMRIFSLGVSWTPKLERIETNGSLCYLMGDLNTTIMNCVGNLPKPHIFTFADLKKATKNFGSASVLGEGSFGKVYKGWLHEKTHSPSESGVGMAVAIKISNPGSLRGFEEWQAEVNFLSRLSHPNLIKLIGFCCEENVLLLVYEYMQEGSLENHLFTRNLVVESLSWELRLKIAIGVARGLSFLHTAENKVIHGDIKPSNILLDGNYNAKLCGFGLVEPWPSYGDSHVPTRVMGTYGYAAPEYVSTGRLYVKSDVYGFGIVLLELMTGSRALDIARPSGQQNLVDWVKPILLDKRKLKKVMDERIEGQYSSKAMMLAAQLSSKCTEWDPDSRPSMKEVLEALVQLYAYKET